MCELQRDLGRDESFICTKCKLSLPRTNLHLVNENRLFQKFAFEPKVKFVTAFLEYNPGGIARKLIHQLKYKGEQELGVILGNCNESDKCYWASQSHSCCVRLDLETHMVFWNVLGP